MTSKRQKIFWGTIRFISFFCLIGFVLACSFFVFFNGIELPTDIIEKNAKLTFLNALLLTMIFWLADYIRVKITVDKPVKNIVKGLEKIAEGNFNVRVEMPSYSGTQNDFRYIVDSINFMAGELSNVETLRTDFISNVSHELKTPLAIIQNYSTLLQSEDYTSGEKKKFAKTISETSRNLANLITNMLKLNKLDNQQIYPDKKEYNLSEQLCGCLIGFEEVWEKKNIDIGTDIVDGATISADEELLTLVWNNLFSNAFKFTSEGGTVNVSLKCDNDYAIVSVADTGCGMSTETGRHIFEKFYQGDTSHAMQGNGLGLALVKRVIDIMGGEIFVKSELGKGSTFMVKLRRDDI